jgi:arylformamidase
MLYDVSLPLSPDLAVWPGDPPIGSEIFPGDVTTSRWTLGSHAGTHVDAPRHFLPGAPTLDGVELSQLVGPCRLCALPAVARITRTTLAALPLAGVERLVLKTRNSAQWVKTPHLFDYDFVGLDLGAADYLVDLGVKTLGVDGLSVEPYAGDGAVHRRLLGAGILLVEGMNLASVPAGDYTLICAPLRLVAADGAPARVFLQGGADDGHA